MLCDSGALIQRPGHGSARYPPAPEKVPTLLTSSRSKYVISKPNTFSPPRFTRYTGLARFSVWFSTQQVAQSCYIRGLHSVVFVSSSGEAGTVVRKPASEVSFLASEVATATRIFPGPRRTRCSASFWSALGSWAYLATWCPRSSAYLATLWSSPEVLFYRTSACRTS